MAVAANRPKAEMESRLEQVTKKLFRARRSGHVEENGIAARFDRHTKAKKPAALPFSIDHLDDRTQRLRARVEIQPIAALDDDPRTTSTKPPELHLRHDES